jgi:hypothetical protein
MGSNTRTNACWTILPSSDVMHEVVELQILILLRYFL